MKGVIAALAMLVNASCVSDGDDWMFGATRAVWSEEALAGEETPLSMFECWGGDHEDLAALAILLIGLPLAIDVVLLPITLPHDLSR